ncbi:unnamed protein product [Ilex paraguariensis]|uniref:Uncharacterized protein n=1 Tax=Ilex paraguariensis TaxID=185542 RepID=A0ABC8U959_9AQUA
MEEVKRVDGEDVSSAQAVLLGALAPGVNGPTWSTLKIAFFMLSLCLAAMLGLAFSASDSALILHVTFLVLITGTLFLLLTRSRHPDVKTGMTVDRGRGGGSSLYSRTHFKNIRSTPVHPCL